MKRVIQFSSTDIGYACFENDEKVFEISKTNLQFDVKAFYQAFYSNGKDYMNIEIINCISGDKNGQHIYECIELLMKQISEKLSEIHDDEENITKNI